MEKRPNSQEQKATATKPQRHLKIRRQFDPSYNGTPGEVNSGELKTVPDQHLTIRQLLINHTRGLHSEASHNEPIYTDQEIPRFNDLNDVVEYKQQLQDREDELKEQIKAEKAEAKQKRLDAQKDKTNTNPQPDKEQG